MKQCVTPYHFEVVEKRQKNRSAYTLLRLEGRDLLKYAVAVEDSVGHDLVLLSESREASTGFFDTAVEGELSSIQLYDAAEDFFHALVLEIF